MDVDILNLLSCTCL